MRCEWKVQYPRRKAALTAAGMLARFCEGGKLRVYKCSYCGWWHLTHQESLIALNQEAA
jgi:hypothetical protein